MIRHPIQDLKVDDLYLENDHGVVLNHLSLKVRAGENIWIQGETSDYFLLRVLAGLEPSTQGRYSLNGQSVYDMSFEQFIPYRMNLGYAFPWGGILNNRTIRDNIMLPFMYHGFSYRQAEQIAVTRMEEFGLTKYASKRPASIPGAMRKLTCLVRTLALEPQILLLDDPLAALPREAIGAFHAHLERQRKAQPDLTLIVTGPVQDGFDMKQFRKLQIANGRVENLPPTPDKWRVA